MVKLVGKLSNRGKIVMSHVHFRLFCTLRMYYIFLLFFKRWCYYNLCMWCFIFPNDEIQKGFCCFFFFSMMIDYFIENPDPWFWAYNRQITSEQKKTFKPHRKKKLIPFHSHFKNCTSTRHFASKVWIFASGIL